MSRHARHMAQLAIAVLAVVVVGCARFQGGPPETKPGYDPNATSEPLPTAERPLTGACPTLAEAKAAVPAITGGPDANDSPFKTMVLQCVYELPGVDAQLRRNGISILVFDATVEGKALWDSVRVDPAFPNATDIPGLGDVGFRTGTPGQRDLNLWVVEGRYGFHLFGAAGVPLEQLVALARAMLAGLARIG